MVNWFKKNKHPLYGKVRSIETKDKIRLATAGINNPMFGKSHTIYSKNLISLALSKPVYIYIYNCRG